MSTKNCKVLAISSSNPLECQSTENGSKHFKRSDTTLQEIALRDSPDTHASQSTPRSSLLPLIKVSC